MAASAKISTCNKLNCCFRNPEILLPACRESGISKGNSVGEGLQLGLSTASEFVNVRHGGRVGILVS